MQNKIKELIRYFTPDNKPFTENGFFEVLEKSVADHTWQQQVFQVLNNLNEMASDSKITQNDKVTLLVAAESLEDDDRFGWFANAIRGNSMTIGEITVASGQSYDDTLKIADLLYHEGYLEVIRAKTVEVVIINMKGNDSITQTVDFTTFEALKTAVKDLLDNSNYRRATVELTANWETTKDEDKQLREIQEKE